MDFQAFITDFAEQLKSQTPIDWAITFTALLYVWLAARESPWCWVSGIVSSGLWAWADFARYNLWLDGLLQAFYVLMGFIGLYTWLFAKQRNQAKLAIQRLSLRQHGLLWLAGGALTFALGFLFKKYTTTSFPYADSFITAFSIIATFLTIKKVLENWLYWVLFDTLAIFLFLAKDAVLVAVVMVVYTAMAIYGYLNWKKEMLH
ncbi:MAG: hypothetical protein GC192_04105 [Bacteroidetes bacterium]|nr:hypothetical protein [Bacteroidota bacterium]